MIIDLYYVYDLFNIRKRQIIINPKKILFSVSQYQMTLSIILLSFFFLFCIFHDRSYNKKEKKNVKFELRASETIKYFFLGTPAVSHKLNQKKFICFCWIWFRVFFFSWIWVNFENNKMVLFNFWILIDYDAPMFAGVIN